MIKIKILARSPSLVKQLAIRLGGKTAKSLVIPNPLVRQLANPLSQQAGKWLVIPQAGEGADVSLRELQFKE